MRKTTTLAPKKPSATDAKLRASTTEDMRASTTEDTSLSPIKEEDSHKEDSQMPEVLGSSNTMDPNTPSHTLESMEPLSDLQKVFFQSCLDDNRNRMAEDRREERRSYEETISRMQEQMQEMREDYDTFDGLATALSSNSPPQNTPLKPRKFNVHKTRHTKKYSQQVNKNLTKMNHQQIPSGIKTPTSPHKTR